MEWANPISAGVGAIGSIIGSIGQKRRDRLNQQRQHEYNKELAQFSFDKNKEMWDLQNQYNIPKAQMQRLKDAGINPHMAYAKGTPQNVSGAGPTYNQETTDQTLPTAINPLDMLGQYQSVKQQNASIDLTQRQVETQEKETKLKEIQGDLTAKRRKNPYVTQLEKKDQLNKKYEKELQILNSQT